MNAYRFVNLVESSSLEKKLIQSYVKHIRIEYLIKNTDHSCENNFVTYQNILTNFEKLSQMVGDKNSHEINLNSSQSNINFGAKMFITLNSCPSFYVKLYWKAIYGGDYKIAKFASNIIWKAKYGFKERAQKIFAKISSMLGFQHISYHKRNKSIGMNIDLSKNMVDVKGV